MTQIACDTCKDAGQSAISTKVEIAGKLAVLVISLPLFKALMDIVAALLSA
ncbi:MAG: stage III sporulation AC/AD family protein [Hydrogenoanaerobacterium sp.]